MVGGLGTKDHRFAGSESGRVERRHEVAVPTMDGRNQSAFTWLETSIKVGGLGPFSLRRLPRKYRNVWFRLAA
jgi:hypothetical protein